MLRITTIILIMWKWVLYCFMSFIRDFPGGSVVKNFPDSVSIRGLGRSPGKRNGNPLHLAWETPSTEEPGTTVHWVVGVGHNLVTKQQQQ